MIGNAIGIPFQRGGAGTVTPEAPTDLVLVLLTDTSIKLTWTDNSDNENGFRVYISTNGSTFTEKGTVSADTTTYTAEGLTANTLYYFYVVAYKDGIESNPTDIESIFIPAKLLVLDFIKRTLEQYVYDITNEQNRNNYLGNSSILNSNIKGWNWINLTAESFVQGATDPDGNNKAWTITAGDVNGVCAILPYEIPNGESCILSFWARANTPTSINIYANWAPSYTSKSINITSIWQLFTITDTYASGGLFWIGGGNSLKNKIIEIWHPMVNLGTEVLEYNETPNSDWFNGDNPIGITNDGIWNASNYMEFLNNQHVIRKPNNDNLTGIDEFTIAILMRTKEIESVQGGQILHLNFGGTELLAHGRKGKVTYISSDNQPTGTTDEYAILMNDIWFVLVLIKDSEGIYLRVNKCNLVPLLGITEGMLQTIMPGLVNQDMEIAGLTVWNKGIKTPANYVFDSMDDLRNGLLPLLDTLIVCDGDSLTDAGYAGTTIFTVYPYLLQKEYGGKAQVLNVGLGGASVFDMTISQPDTVTPLYTSVYKNKILTIMVGVNHEGQDSTICYAELVALCNERKSEGWKIVICTFTPITVQGDYPPWQETYRQELNALIRTNYTSFADALADVGADSRIGDFGDQEDLTYYDTDEIHLNATGHVVVAEIIKAAIDTIIE